MEFIDGWVSELSTLDLIFYSVLAILTVRIIFHKEEALIFDGSKKAKLLEKTKSRKRTVVNHIQRIFSFLINAPFFVGSSFLCLGAFKWGVFVYSLQAFREYLNITHEWVREDRNVSEEDIQRRMALPPHMDSMELTVFFLAIILGIAGTFQQAHLTLFVFFSVLFMMILINLFENRKGGAGALVTLGVHLFGLLWLVFSSGYAGLIITHKNGGGLMAMSLTCGIMGDVLAFYVGSLFGRFKAIPHVSKAKTYEGMIAAVSISVFLASMFFKFKHVAILDLPDLPLAQYLVMGALIGVTGVLGDLVESMVKRSCKVKDSGTVFTGHGGVMDRFDTFFIVSPYMYYFALFVLEGTY